MQSQCSGDLATFGCKVCAASFPLRIVNQPSCSEFLEVIDYGRVFADHLIYNWQNIILRDGLEKPPFFSQLRRTHVTK